jgi:hypothetical protein
VNRFQRIIVLAFLFFISVRLFAAGGTAAPFRILRVASADTPGRGSLNWRVHSTYFTQRFRPGPGEHVSQSKTTALLGIGYMLTDRLGIGASSDLVRSVSDTGDSWQGVLGFEAKGCLFQVSALKTGIILFSSLPVYATRDAAKVVTLAPQLALTLDPVLSTPLAPYRIHLNLGYSLSTDGDRLNDLVLFGLGVELATRQFTPFMEFTSELAIHDDSFSLRENRMRLTPGLKWEVSEGIDFRFGLDLSLSKPPLPGMKNVEDWQVNVGAMKL